MKISIITWDASFRECFHTVECFLNQAYPEAEYEFIWVDFYRNENAELLDLINQSDNFHLLNLNHGDEEVWHLGECINAGVTRSTGDILILPDGDILADSELLTTVEAALSGDDSKVVYFRRWDERAADHDAVRSYEIKYLESVCVLNNPTNYAGLVAMNRSTFELVGGYEEHAIFAGPGANGMEQYLRFRNAGCYIQWHLKKIYHPYHSFTGTSDKFIDELIRLKAKHPWLNPYSGIAQSWFLHQTERRLRSFAGEAVASIVDSTPTLDALSPKRGGKKNKLFNWLFH